MKSIELISDFNLELLQKIFLKSKKFQVKKFDYSNIFFQIKNGLSSDINLILASAEGIFSSYNDFLNNGSINFSKLDKELTSFKSLLVNDKNIQKKIYICTFINYQQQIINSINNYNNSNSVTYILNYINNKLSEFFSKNNNVYLFDLNDLILKYKSQPIDQNYYLISKSYFNLKFYIFFEKEFRKLINLCQKKIKLILLDLDDTLWGGTVAEIGWEKINLGGNNVLGEAFKNFQKNLLRLKKIGIPLALVSKNNYETAIKAINKHPEMILKSKDFIISKINWKEKANNILEIANELNLTTDSFVFFDNSKFERENAKQRIPDITVPDLSGGPLSYCQKLSELGIVLDKNITTEDKKRSQMYKENFKRDLVIKKYLKKDDWIKQLKIKIKFEKFKKENEDRIIQLFNKTNQMNLRTNRYNNLSLYKLIKKKNTNFYSVKVYDKFGYYGLTALLTIAKKDKIVFLDDFVMSCRVTGRGVEENIIKFIKKKYSNKNIEIIFKLKKTKKNDLMQNFLLDKNVFKEIKRNTYSLI